MMVSSINKTIEAILDEIDTIQVPIIMPNSGENKRWNQNIPSEPGWYWIKTNAKISTLIEIKYKQGKHTNISETIEKTSILHELELAITQSANEDYVVYNGEAHNLKARAREHFQGHRVTYCLGISDHKSLLNYNWTFYYVPVSKCKTIPEKYSEDTVLRIAVEQAWRAKHGWPILCRK